MTLRTALIIDGDASKAAKATDAAATGLRQVDAAADAAAAGARNLAGAERAQEAALQGSTAAMRVNTAAMAANNAATRQATAQRANLIFQLNDIFVSLASGQNAGMVAIQQGSQISTIYGPGGLGKALSETGKIVTGVITRFGVLGVIAGAVGLGIAGLQGEINKAGKSIEVSFGDTALAIFQTLGGYIGDTLKPAVEALAPVFDLVWERVKSATAGTINALVRGWFGFLAEMELIASALEHVFDISWQNIYNGAVDLFQQLLESLWLDINKLLTLLGQKAVTVDLSFAKMEAPEDGWSGPLLERLNKRREEIAKTDYAGQFFDDIGTNARQNALDREKDKKTKKTKQSDYDREIEQIRERTAALQVESNVVGLSTYAAEKMRKTLELETAAKKDAIGLSPARVAQIETEASAYARAAAALEQQKSAFDAFSNAGEQSIDRLVDAFMGGGESIGEAINGIIKDITRLVIEMAVINPIKNSLFGGSNPTFAGLGDALSGLFGGGRASGGPVSPGKLYRVGEQGEEWFAPSVAGTIVPNGQIGGGGGSFTQVIRNYSGEKISTRNKKGADGGTLQEMVIGTVREGMARDEFRSNGIRGATKSR